jgi:SAM-dependent methyltransferase
LAKQYAYTGQDNLEVMQDAVNYNRYQLDFLMKEINKLKKGQNVRILDVGAGIGTYADMLKGESVHVDCVEPDVKQAEVLVQKGYKVYKDINDIKEPYDVIYALNVLEHIKDDAALLADMKNHVAKDGRIIIYVPAFMVLFSKLDVLVEHFRRYRIKDVKQLARKTGLTISSVKYCDPIGFMSALAYRAVGGSGNLSHASVWIFDRILFPISKVLEFFTQKLFGKNVLVIYTKT